MPLLRRPQPTHGTYTWNASNVVGSEEPRLYWANVGSCGIGLGSCSRPKIPSELLVKCGALGSLGASRLGSLPYHVRTLSKKSLKLPVVRICCPAGPARMPVARVAITLMIFGSVRMGGAVPSGRSKPLSSREARYISSQVDWSAARVVSAVE